MALEIQVLACVRHKNVIGVKPVNGIPTSLNPSLNNGVSFFMHNDNGSKVITIAHMKNLYRSPDYYSYIVA